MNATNQNGESIFKFAANQGNHEMLNFLSRFAILPPTDRAEKPSIRRAVKRSYGKIRQLLSRRSKVPSKLHPAPTKTLLIPPNELAFTQLVEKGNVGGDFLAKWLDADVVVKLFHPNVVQSSFHEEAQVWQRLRHPNVIKTYGACIVTRVPNLQFFVCEYASGGSLLDYVRSNHVGDTNLMMWKFLHGAALGLAYLHERKIIHGDLRCSSILIGCDGLSKLSNFGLSGSCASGALKVGTKRWMAPEVLGGGAPSFVSDVYSLGMCLVEAATGKAPWGDHDESWALYSKNIWEPELDFENNRVYDMFAPACPSGNARDLVWRICCKNPDKRMSLSSVICELDRLTKQGDFQSKASDVIVTFDKFKVGQAQELWTCVVNGMENCSNQLYQYAFNDLKQLQERLLNSPHSLTLLEQFHFLLIEFQAAISMTPDLAHAMRLSSTRAATTSAISFHRRIQWLWQSLGETVEVTEERKRQWNEQQRDAFMMIVSDLYLRLNDLGSDEERHALIETLRREAVDHDSKYSPDQLYSMKKMIDAVDSKLEEKCSIPEWFIPWYELGIAEASCLGAGGFGSVYRAKWLDSDVVVKRLGVDSNDTNTTAWSNMTVSNTKSAMILDARTSTTRADGLAEFQREVNIWFIFRHPHVIQLFGACHIGRPFFVCEYATNGTLVTYLKVHPDELWEKLHEAALGVQYLHARNVVHGDLKGNNIVVGSDKMAKVTDFGLSTLMSETGSRQISAASHWVAPECFEANSRLTIESDIYSLGMCIVEAMRVVEAVNTGSDTVRCLPWIDLPNEAVRAHAKKGILPLPPNMCTNDDRYWNLVKRMCAREPKQRMKISTVVDELARISNRQVVAETIVEAALGYIPNTISSACKFMNNMHGSQRELPLYVEMWNRFERVLFDLENTSTTDSHAVFNSLIADAYEALVAR